MDQESTDLWFYTCKGQRLGPSPIEELKDKIKNNEIDPISDLVWQKGMPNWRAAGEMKVLYGKKAKPAPPKPAPPKPAPTPQAITPVPAKKAPKSAKDITWPGSRRRSYLFMLFIFPALWAAGFQRVIDTYGPMLGNPTALSAITIAGSLVPALFIFLFTLQRLTNIGMSRWWVIGHFVPLLNLWVGYRCFAAPAGYSSHGKLGGIGWLLALIYWGSILLVIAAVATGFALIFLILTDPAFINEVMTALQDDPTRQAQFQSLVDQVKQALPDLLPEDPGNAPAPDPAQ